MPANAMTDGSSALALLSMNAWRLSYYLRISQEDKKAGESASITHQRTLIRDFISRTEEFSGAEATEYVDDGLSGANTDREDYTRLMRDVERGAVNCIIVKDLSRIGRNMLEVDDLLMNYLVEKNVRFISLGDRYDSFIHPLSVLELAAINLFNQDYIRDLAEKSMSSRLVKIKHGEFLGCYAPFGYIKSKTEKNRMVVDSEAAEYVRLMFSLATEGRNAREVAAILNAQEIPTPSVYKKTRHGKGSWKTTDPDFHFWNGAMVYDILCDERYTGKAISNRYGVKEHGSHLSVKRDKSEWIVVPGAHEGIITDDEYQRARDALARSKHDGVPLDHIFHTKVRCAVCGHAMQRTQSKCNPAFKCVTRRYTNHYTCPEKPVPQADIERAALESLKVYTDVLIEREEVKLAALRQSNDSKAVVEGKIRAERQAIKVLEGSVTKIFTSLASGDMTKEAFLSKKEVINAAIAKKKAAIETLEERLAALTTGRAAMEAALSELYSFRNLERLDRDLVDLLVGSIRIHGDREIEIVWNDRR